MHLVLFLKEFDCSSVQTLSIGLGLECWPVCRRQQWGSVERGYNAQSVKSVMSVNHLQSAAKSVMFLLHRGSSQSGYNVLLNVYIQHLVF